ncbi:MAG: tetratricopeptide repeat protein [Myxococcaceae bacterium]|nr:tetratricopeptide repeat protein [Myxococcaceae bacterium]
MRSKLSKEGGRLMQGGLVADAIRTFEKGVTADPKDADCWLGLGRAFLSQGRPEQARTALSKLLALEPEHLEAQSAIALVDFHSGKEDALQRLEAVSANEKAGFFEHYNLAGVLQGRGDLAGAEAAYERALKASPDNPFALVEVGLLALDRGDTKAALPKLKRAAELMPNEWVPQQSYARALVRDGQLGQAAHVLNQAVAKHPDEPSLYLDLFQFSMLAGSTASAVRAAVELRRLKPEEANPIYLHGLALFTSGDVTKARPLFEEAVNRAPRSWEAKQALAKCLVLEKKLDAAQKLLEEANAAQPTAAGPANDLASLLLSKKQGAQAEGVLRRVLAFAPEDEATNLNLALAYVQQGKKAQAKPHVQACLKSADKDLREQAERLKKQVG